MTITINTDYVMDRIGDHGRSRVVSVFDHRHKHTWVCFSSSASPIIVSLLKDRSMLLSHKSKDLFSVQLSSTHIFYWIQHITVVSCKRQDLFNLVPFTTKCEVKLQIQKTVTPVTYNMCSPQVILLSIISYKYTLELTPPKLAFMQLCWLVIVIFGNL